MPDLTPAPPHLPPPPPLSDAFAPGPKTSEWRLTFFAQIVGAVLEGLALVIHTMQAGGVNASWFAAALAVVGVLLQLATAFGYSSSRATVKAAAIEAGHTAAVRVTTPTEAAAVLRGPPPKL